MANDLLVRIGADFSGFSAEMDRLNRVLSQAAQKARQSLGGFEAFGDNLVRLGQQLSLGISAPISAFSGLAIKAASDLDALKRGLSTVAKTASETERQFKELIQVAKLPGIGLEEAVRGATNLQALNFNFQQSKEILLQFGNAIASVGKGKEDLNEVIRQLGQMAARGKVTADNLKPILERVPQVAEVIRKHFGKEGLDTEHLQKLGVSAQEFIDVLIKGLSELPRVSGGIKNSLENLSDAGKRALAAVGDAIINVTSLDTRIDRMADVITDLAQRFKELPAPVQAAAVALGGVATVGPIMLFFAGQMAQSFVMIATAFKGIQALNIAGAFSNAAFALSNNLVPALTLAEKGALALTIAFRAIPWVALAAGIGYLGSKLNEFAVKTDSSSDAMKRINERWREQNGILTSTQKTYNDVLKFVTDIGKASGKTAIDADKLKSAFDGLGLKSSRVLNEELKKARQNLDYISEAFKAGEATAYDLKNAQDAVTKATQALHAAQIKLGTDDSAAKRQQLYIEAWEDAWERVDKFAHDYEQAAVKLNQIDKDLTKSKQDLATDYAKAHEKMREETLKTVEVINGHVPVPQDIQDAIAATIRLQEAMKEAGADKLATQQQVDRAKENFELISKSGRATAAQLLKAWVTYEEARQDLARASGKVISAENEKALKDAKEKLGELDGVQRKTGEKTRDTWKEIQREVKRAFDGMARGMADAIVKWQGFGDTLKRVAQEFASGILEIFIQRLLDPLQKRLEDVLGTIFGDKNGQVGVIKNAVGGSATGAAGSAGSAGSGAGSGVGAGLAGTVGAIGSVASAISGVIGNFQMHGMNKSLDLIEHEVRYSQNHLLHLLENSNKWLPELGIIRGYLFDTFNPAFAGLLSTVEAMAKGATGGDQKVQLVVDGRVLAEAVAKTLPRYSGAFA